MDAYYPVSFFNGRYNLKDALVLSAPDIINLFQKIAADAQGNNKNRFGVHEEARAYIQDAVTMIKTLHERYVDLLKAKTPDEYPGFIIVPDKDTTGIRFGSLTVDYQGNKFELRTLYDILGWIFSVVGNVPVVPVATRENYYYPLMMIARVFSAKLISNTKAPDVWMVMWFKQMVNDKQVTRVVLGATLDDPLRNVKEETKDFRKDVMKKAHVLFWRDGTPAPMQDQEPRGVVGQDFGHCAESYPLLFICSLGTGKDRSKIRESAKGVAAKTKTLYDNNTITIKPCRIADSDIVNPKIIPPCYNCASLILMNGLTLANFDWDLHNKGAKVPSK